MDSVDQVARDLNQQDGQDNAGQDAAPAPAPAPTPRAPSSVSKMDLLRACFRAKPQWGHEELMRATGFNDHSLRSNISNLKNPNRTKPEAMLVINYNPVVKIFYLPGHEPVVPEGTVKPAAKRAKPGTIDASTTAAAADAAIAAQLAGQAPPIEGGTETGPDLGSTAADLG